MIRFNSKNTQAAERYANIARFIHLPGNTTAELIDALIEELREMNRQLNIPLGIKNYGQGGVLADTSIIDENEFNAPSLKSPKMQLPMHARALTLASHAGRDGKLLKACYYDTEIDF